MNLEDRAEKLVDCLQAVIMEAKGADQRNPGVCELLSRQEIQVLLALGLRGPLIMRDVAEAILLSLSSVTGIVDSLERKRVVRRERSSADRRVVRVALTPEGRRLYALARDGHIEFARRMLRALGAEEQEALVSLFRKISRAMSAKAEEAHAL